VRHASICHCPTNAKGCCCRTSGVLPRVGRRAMSPLLHTTWPSKRGLTVFRL